ncbi:MAG: hypothetical protein HYW48_04500 [Deltaproteobacteria bacterium]|nr:hypothetical protein [Deltaproteobacteria bacterium]
MVVKKVVLTSMLLVCPWLGTAYAEDDTSSSSTSEGTSTSGTSASVESLSSASSDETVQGLDEVRKQCEELRGDSQRKPFQIVVNCSGSNTYYVEEIDHRTLANQETTTAQTTTKAGRYRSVGVVTTGSMPGHDVTCKRYKKMKLSVPKGFGIPKTIQECDELTPANLKLICTDEVREYCAEQKVTGSSSQSGSSASSSDDAQQDSAGACVLETVEVVDGCAGYN